MPLYELITNQSTSLLADSVTGVISHSVGAPRGKTRVFVWQPDGVATFGCLVPLDAPAQPLRLEGDREVHDVVGLSVVTTRFGVALYNPLTGQVVTTAETGDRVYLADTPNACHLRPLRHVPQRLAERAAALDATHRAAASGAAVAALLLEGEKLPYGLSAILRGLPPAEMATLGRALAAAPQGARLAASVGDPWAARALPRLRQRGDFPRQLGRELDHLMVDGLGGKYVSVWQMVNSFARRAVAPTRRFCVLTTARNEGAYLLEWLAYYRLLGAEAFFFYTNDNEDGSDELLAALNRAGIIHLLHNDAGPGVNPQYRAYGHAFQMLPEILDYRWAAVVDLDEFIAFDTVRHPRFTDLLDEMEEIGSDAVALNWVIYASSGQAHWQAEPVLERFQYRVPGTNPHVKSIFRPASFIHAHPHFPIWDPYTKWQFTDAAGHPHPQDRTGDASAFSPKAHEDVAWINHYFTKSAEEYAARRTTLRPHRTGAPPPPGELFNRVSAEWFMSVHASAALEHDTRALHCAPALHEEIEHLRALPGVAAAEARAEAWLGRRIRETLAMLAADPRTHVPGSAEHALLETLGEA